MASEIMREADKQIELNFQTIDALENAKSTLRKNTKLLKKAKSVAASALAQKE